MAMPPLPPIHAAGTLIKPLQGLWVGGGGGCHLSVLQEHPRTLPPIMTLVFLRAPYEHAFI